MYLILNYYFVMKIIKKMIERFYKNILKQFTKNELEIIDLMRTKDQNFWEKFFRNCIIKFLYEYSSNNHLLFKQ